MERPSAAAAQPMAPRVGHGSTRLVEAVDATAAGYSTTSPWPHLVMDDVFPARLISAVAGDAERVSESFMVRDIGRLRKAELATAPGDAGAELQRLLAEPALLSALGRLVGVDDLRTDDAHFQAGLFVNGAGSYHRPHFDFPRNPETGLWQRLALLVYLNDWPVGYGGQLELMPTRHRDQAPVTIQPRLGRVVVMETSGRAKHAVQEVVCPPGLTRLALAARYYSAVPPVHKVPARSKVFRLRRRGEPWWFTLPSGRELRLVARHVGRRARPVLLRRIKGTTH